MGSFCPTHIKFQRKKSEKSTEELSLMTLKSDAKFKENRFQIWHEEFGEFSPNHSKSENFTSVGSFYSKYIRFQLKKIQRNYLSWCKFWINPDLVASKMAWGIGWTFIRALKSEKLYIDELFWSKAFNVLARKLQRKYVSWYWKAIQNLKENWLVAWKMT